MPWHLASLAVAAPATADGEACLKIVPIVDKMLAGLTALTRAAPEICTDKDGFDRAGFHSAFNRDVVGFFRRTLQ